MFNVIMGSDLYLTPVLDYLCSQLGGQRGLDVNELMNDLTYLMLCTSITQMTFYTMELSVVN